MTIKASLGEDTQNKIVKLLKTVAGKYPLWEVWRDFIIMHAILIANSLGGPYKEQREKTYKERAGRYSKGDLDILSQVFDELTSEMTRNPNQDFLGNLFMTLGLGNEWGGQFFTPYNVCQMMAAMTMGTEVNEKIEKRGWASVADFACGAGALLIAYANECRATHINYQTSVLFVAQDIDLLAGCMCYIQMSLLGCPGYVIIGDSLSEPLRTYDNDGLIPVEGPNIWFTPMFFRDVWTARKICAYPNCCESFKLYRQFDIDKMASEDIDNG